MDRSHPQKGTDIHNTIGPDLESLGKENLRKRRGRPRNSKRRDLEADSQEMGYKWNQVERLAQDQVCWRAAVDGLYP